MHVLTQYHDMKQAQYHDTSMYNMCHISQITIRNAQYMMLSDVKA